jgi:4-amino-4-deoxy-L-arabinose transferase-like glycosyltransferase
MPQEPKASPQKWKSLIEYCSPETQRRILIAVLIIVVCALLWQLLFFCLGAYPLLDPDEPRYAEAARQMAVYGNWITPHFNGLIRLEKPPLFYWLAAFSYETFGISEWAARLPSAIFGAFTVILCSLVTGWRASFMRGFKVGIILTTSILFFGIARMSITDMTLTAWLTGAGLSLYLVAHKHARWWLLTGLFMGLALLTKGPVGLAIPLMVLGLYSVLFQRFRQSWLTPWMPVGITLALAIAAPWYVLAYQANGDFFLQSLLWNNVTRYSSVVSGHKQPGWYYLAVLLIGFMPWTPYLPAAIRSLWNKSFWLEASIFKGKALDFDSQTSDMLSGHVNDQSALLRYVVLWAVFVLTFFMVGQTRLPTYILPMFPPLAIALGLLWPVSAKEDEAHYLPEKPLSLPDFPSWWLTSACLSLVLSLGGALFFTTRYQSILHLNGLEASLWSRAIILSAIQFGIFNIGGFICFLRRDKAASLIGFGGAITSLSFLVFGGLMQQMAVSAQQDTMRFLARVDQSPMAIYDLQRPSLTYYGMRNFPRFSSKEGDQLVRWLGEQHDKKKHAFAYVILRKHRIAPLEEQLKASYPTSSVHIQRVEPGPKYNLISVFISAPQVFSLRSNVTPESVASPTSQQTESAPADD